MKSKSDNQEATGTNNPNDSQVQQELPHHKWFYFKHGRKAKNIEELKEALKSMNDAEFNHHVNDTRNDFANWVEHVFGEKELADKLRKVYNKEDTYTIIDEFLKTKSSTPFVHQEQSRPRQQYTPRHGKEKIKPEVHDEKAKILPAFEEHEYLTFDEHTTPKLYAEAKEQEEEKEKSSVDITEEKATFKEISEEKEEEQHYEDYPELPVIKPIDDFEKESEIISSAEEETKIEEKSEDSEEKQKEEKVLSESELQKVVMNAKQALEEEAQHHELFLKHQQEWHHKFIVKEFIYGFVLGLIFGMMMLGFILKLNGA